MSDTIPPEPTFLLARFESHRRQMLAAWSAWLESRTKGSLILAFGEVDATASAMEQMLVMKIKDAR